LTKSEILKEVKEVAKLLWEFSLKHPDYTKWLVCKVGDEEYPSTDLKVPSALLLYLKPTRPAWNDSFFVYLFGTSGCGKTRTLYSALVERGGIYCTVNAGLLNGGAKDFTEALLLHHYNADRDRVLRAFKWFIVSRCLIMKEFYSLAGAIEKIDGQDLLKNDHELNQKWLYAQAYSSKFLPQLDDKLKQLFAQGSLRQSKEPDDELIKEARVVLRNRLFVIDECQQIVSLGKVFKSSDAEKKSKVSILSPMFSAIINMFGPDSTFQCVISGTMFAQREIEDAISTASKEISSRRMFSPFTEFGQYDSFDKVKAFLEAATNLTLSDRLVCLALHLFRGRNRFMAEFAIKVVLHQRNGESVEKAFVNAAQEFYNFHNLKENDSSSIKKLVSDYSLEMKGKKTIKLIENQLPIILDHYNPLLEHLLRGDFANCYVDEKAVKHGLGQVVGIEPFVYKITEPLVMSCLVQYFYGWYNIGLNQLNRLATSSSSLGFLFEKTVGCYLVHKFVNSPTGIFLHDLLPPTASVAPEHNRDSEAKSASEEKRWPENVRLKLIGSDHLLLGRLGSVTKNRKEFFRDNGALPPVLFAEGNAAVSDVVIRCSSSDGRRFFFLFQCKLYSRKSPFNIEACVRSLSSDRDLVDSKSTIVNVIIHTGDNKEKEVLNYFQKNPEMNENVFWAYAGLDSEIFDQFYWKRIKIAKKMPFDESVRPSHVNYFNGKQDTFQTDFFFFL